MRMFTQDRFAQIVEGMNVYDRDGVHIGAVKAFRSGEGTIEAQNAEMLTKVEVISQTIGTSVKLPSQLYDRMFAEGFVCVNRGLLRSDGVIFPEQIDEVVDNTIYLKVGRDELASI